MTRENSVNRLFLLWIVLGLPLVILVSVQTINGKYGEDAEIAWSWLLVQVTPVLALLGAAAFSNPSRAWRSKPASIFRWRCALASSLLLGTALIGVLLIEPMVSTSPFELFGSSAIALSLGQGIVLASIGAVVFDGR